jgi:hypothetical protein
LIADFLPFTASGGSRGAPFGLTRRSNVLWSTKRLRRRAFVHCVAYSVLMSTIEVLAHRFVL